jgi:transcriptional regulator with XRE-family HTH domain
MANRSKKPPIDRRIGARIRERRLMLKMSQSHLAEQLSLSFQQVQKYEQGTNDVSVGKLAEIAAFLRVSIDYFFEAPAEPDADSALPAALARASRIESTLSKREDVRLVLAFIRIPDSQIRQHVVQLVIALAAQSDREIRV